MLRADGTVAEVSSLNGATINYQPAGLNGVVALAGGDGHFVALRGDGTVAAWSPYSSFPPTLHAPPAGLTGVRAVACGMYHSLALKSDGTVVAWGANAAGQCVVPAGLDQVTAVAGGDRFSLALRTDGTVVGWGSGYTAVAQPGNLGAFSWAGLKGQGGKAVGLGGWAAPTVTGLPAQVNLEAGDELRLAAIVQGFPAPTLQWRKDGVLLPLQTQPVIDMPVTLAENAGVYELQMTNALGTAIHNVTVNVSAPLRPVLTLHPVTVSLNRGQSGSLSVVATGVGSVSYQWFRDGAVVPGETQSSLIFSSLQAVHAGIYSQGTTHSRLARVALKGDAVSWNATTGLYVYGIPPFALTTVADALRFSDGDAAVVLKADSTLIGAIFSRTVTSIGWPYSTTEYLPVFQTPVGLVNVLQCATRGTRALALRKDGSMVAWTSNSVSSATQTHSTVTLNTPSVVTRVSAVSLTTTQGLALLSDGRVACWDLLTGASVTPPVSLTNVMAVSSGKDHHMALLEGGSVVAWGDNSNGETDVPPLLTNVRAISAGEDFSVAVRADGSVAAWGINTMGECTPPTGLTNVVKVSAGNGGVYATQQDSNIVCWGDRTLRHVWSFMGTDYSRSFANTAAPSVRSDSAGGLGITVYGVPAFSQQPMSATLTEGESHALTTISGGYGTLAYQWFKDGVAILNASTARLDLGILDPSESGSYTLAVTNSFGTTTSAAAVITVTPSAVITTQPVSGQIGQALTLTATGYGTLHYQWFRNGSAIGGSTGASFIPLLEGVYHVTVTDDLGTIRSRYARVARASRIISWKDGWAASAAAGPDGELLALSNGDPLICIRSGGALGYLSYGTPYAPFVQPGAEVIYNVATGSSWSYGSVGTMINGGLGVAGTRVPDPAISVAVRAGNAVIATDRGTVFAGRDWRYGNTGFVIIGSGMSSNPGPGLHFGTVLPVPALTQVVEVVATDTAFLARHENGSLTQWEAATGTLQTIPAGVVGVMTAISAGTDHFMALSSTGAVFAWGDDTQGESTLPAGLGTVTAIAAGPDFSVVLKADGTVAAWGDNSSGQTSVPAGLATVTRISATQGAGFAQRVDGSAAVWGAASAVLPTLGVTNISSMSSLPQSSSRIYIGHADYTVPAIHVQPENLSLLSHDGFILRTQVVSMLEPTYQWFRNGYLIPGAVASSYQINPAMPMDGATFHVVITNASGSTTSSSAVVAVQDAPYFNQEPQAVSLNQPGGSAALTVQVSSYFSEAVSYQWHHDGVPVAGATSATLTLPAVTHALTGLYRVIATNSHGSRSSVAARVGIAGMPLAWNAGTTSPVTTSTPATLQALSRGEARFGISSDLRAIGLAAAGMTAAPVDSSSMRSGRATDIAARAGHAMVLAANGQLFCWSWIGGSSFKPESTGTTVAISMSDDECISIRADGAVLRWVTDPWQIDPPVPIANRTLLVPAAAQGATHIVSGADHHLALMPGGTVFAFGGANLHGQTTVPAGLSGVIAIAAGDGFSLALKNDGNIVGWGSNTSGALTMPSGLTDVVKLSAGRGSAIAQHAEGHITTWGTEAVVGGITPTPAGIDHVIEAGTAAGIGIALRSITQPISITQQPQSMRVFFDYTGPGFDVSANSTNALSYQWLSNGYVIPGATSATMPIQYAGYWNGTSSGWYSCVITTSDASITTTPAQLTLVSPNRYASWAYSQFGSIYGPLDTPFGHNVPNLLCQALDLNPRQPEMQRLPQLCFETDAQTGKMHAGLTFEVPDNLNGITFRLRSTHDLTLPAAQWASHAVTPVLGFNIEGRRRLTFVDPQPIGTSCFYRIEVIQSAPAALPEY